MNSRVSQYVTIQLENQFDIAMEIKQDLIPFALETYLDLSDCPCGHDHGIDEPCPESKGCDGEEVINLCKEDLTKIVSVHLKFTFSSMENLLMCQN